MTRQANPDRPSREVAKLEGHGDAVVSCAWSPDGKRLASASWDGTVRVWLSPAVAPILLDDTANVAHVPGGSSLVGQCRMTPGLLTALGFSA
jgi:WD40 repeat protein